jgi:hypothetical protein
LVHLTSGVIETSSEVFQVGVPSRSTLPFPLPGSASKYYSEPLAFYFDKLAQRALLVYKCNGGSCLELPELRRPDSWQVIGCINLADFDLPVFWETKLLLFKQKVNSLKQISTQIKVIEYQEQISNLRPASFIEGIMSLSSYISEIYLPYTAFANFFGEDRVVIFTKEGNFDLGAYLGRFF